MELTRPRLSIPARSLLTAGCAILALAGSARGQILNTVSPEADASPGWSGGAEASFSVSEGNTETLALDGEGHLQVQGARDRLRLTARGEWERTEGKDNAQESVVHLRHNRRLAPWVATLAFLQHQRNPFQRLSSRLLIGAGARLDLLRRPRQRVSLGLSHMVEIERISDVEGRDTDHRLSSFLTGSLKLTDTATLSGTAFVQPLWTDFSDVRALALSALRVDISSKVYVRVSGEYLYDSDPPDRVENSDWKVKTGFGISL